MSDRVFETNTALEFSFKGERLDYEITNAGDVSVTSTVEASWDSQYINFLLSREEATKLKEFLIKHGY